MTDVKKVQSGNNGGEGEAPLSSTGPVATELPSNAYVTGNMNSQFKYMQTDDGPFQEMSKGAGLKSNKYLEKIAAEEKKESKWQVGRGLGAAIAGSFAAVPISLAAMGANKATLASIDRAGASDLGTVKKMMRDNKLNVTFNHRSHATKKIVGKATGANESFIRANVNAIHAGAAGPAYLHTEAANGAKNLIGGVKISNQNFDRSQPKSIIKNKDVIMHELGHAKDYQSFGKAKLNARMYSGKVGALGSTLALMHKDTEDYATGIMAAGQVATLRDEAAANYHAYKGVKAHKGVEAAKKFLKGTAAKNTLGYWGNAAAQIGAVYAGKKILDYTNKKDESK